MKSRLLVKSNALTACSTSNLLETQSGENMQKNGDLQVMNYYAILPILPTSCMQSTVGIIREI